MPAYANHRAINVKAKKKKKHKTIFKNYVSYKDVDIFKI